MTMLETMNQMIEYVEAHLCEELNMSSIAKAVGYSESDIQKTFYGITNISVVEYIRRRRLTLAAHELQSTDQSVLEVALKYGYNSPDSFSRAFKQIHEKTPSEVKKGGCILKSYGKITFVLTIKGVNAMNYKILEKEEMHIIGIKRWFSTENDKQLEEIPKMWNEVSEETRNKIISLSENRGVIGLCADMYDGGFDYWIGAMAAKSNECPAEFEEMTIPKSRWAVFEIIGPIPNAMQEMWKRIYSEWLPNSGYQHAGLPEIEYYSDGDMETSDYKTEIWIPVRK